MENISKFNIKELGKSLFVMGIGLLTVFGVSISLSKYKDEGTVKPGEIIVPVIACPNDTNSFFSTSTKKLTLLENKKSNGTNGTLKGYRVTLKRTGLTSDIACGYLFYQASFDGKPIEQASMALNIKPTNSKLGGHIWPDEKKGAIISILSDKTQVLMPLDTITYDGTTRNPIKEINLAALLNVAQEMEFEIALSADTSLGKLDLVQLGYKCVNKETRKTTEECNLEVKEVVAF